MHIKKESSGEVVHGILVYLKDFIYAQLMFFFLFFFLANGVLFFFFFFFFFLQLYCRFIVMTGNYHYNPMQCF